MTTPTIAEILKCANLQMVAVLMSAYPKPDRQQWAPCRRSTWAVQIDDFIWSNQTRFSGQRSAISQSGSKKHANPILSRNG